jgi:eukaryotic-like serine/threonine-protein kinase
MSAMQRPAFDEALVQRLPLPLAQLYRRAHNAKTPLERHHAAFYLWEASLKLLGSVAIAAFAQRRVHDEQLTERLQNLARPALGHWWEFVRRLLPLLAEAGEEPFAAPRDLILGRSRDDLPHAAGLDAVMVEALEGKAGARATVRVSELFDRLVRYRNREIGHGASGQQAPAHYDRVGRALLAGVGELLSRLDPLAGRQLLYVAEVRRRGDGSWLIERGDLSREMFQRLESGVVADGIGDLPNPERLYLRLPGVDGLQSLHPLAVFDPEANEVLFLNARRSHKRIEYLSYSTGRVEEFDSLAGEQRALLRRVLDVEVDAAALAAWAVRSQAEETEEGGASPEMNDAARALGDFERLSELGRGGMGVVYRAWQASLGRQVALKCLYRSGDPKAEARFRREIHALGRVEHPHLVKIFTSGSDGDQWFYAMELIEGATLASVCERLQTRGSAADLDLSTWQETVSAASAEARRAETPLAPTSTGAVTSNDAAAPAATAPLLPPETAPTPALVAGHGSRAYVRHVVELVQQVAEAAQALHNRGIIHRDIKPGNIMVSADGASACLMDLGLAQLADEVEGRLTKTRQFVGTLRYASPEQVLAVSQLTAASDVYSLGATLWELLTLRPLYGAGEGTPDVELMRRIQFEEPESARRHNRGVPRDLEAIVGRCLRKDPRRRYSSAHELGRDLNRFLEGKPVQARPVSSLERGWKWVKRRPTAAAMLILVPIAVVSLLVGGLWYRWAQEERQLAAQMKELRDKAQENEAEANKQRGLAEVKEQEAEQSAREARQNEAKANDAAADAKRERQRAERLQYAADINLAQQAFKENRLFRMRELLLRHEKAEHLKGFEWHYLWQLCRDKLVLGPRHSRPARAVAFSPDGRRAASGSDGGAVKIWDTATGKEMFPVMGHRKTVHAVAFHPSGKTFGTASIDNIVSIWDCGSGEELYRIAGAAGTLHSIAFSRDGKWLAVAGNDDSIVLCDAADGKERKRFPAFDQKSPMNGGHRNTVNGVAFSPDGKRLASASADKTVIVWNVAEGKQERKLEGHSGRVYDVAFSPDGKLLASSDDSSSTIIVWSPETGKEIRRHSEHTLPITGIAFSPDGRQLVSAGADATVRIRDIGSDKEPNVLYGTGGPVYGGSFSSDGARLVLSGSDGSTQVWDLTVDEDSLFQGWIAKQAGLFLALSPNGKWIARGGDNNEVCLWGALSKQKERVFTGHRADVQGVAFSPDGRWLVSGGQDKVAKVWDIEGQRELLEFRGHEQPILPVAYDPRGRFVATGDRDGLVMIWGPRTGETLAAPDLGKGQSVTGLAFSPNGERLAAGAGKKLILYDTANWGVIRAWEDYPQSINGVAYAPDNVRVAVALTDGTVIINDERRDEPVVSLHAHYGRAMGLTFSQNGQRLVTGGFNESVRIWDSQTGQPLLTLSLPATSLALSADGRRLIAINMAGFAVWFADGKPGDKGPVPERWIDWYRSRAKECNKAKQWAAEEFYCGRLIETDPGREVEYRQVRAGAAYERSDWERVVADLTRTLQLKEPTVLILNTRGEAYFGLRQYALAEADYTRALEIDPKSRNAWAFRGDARSRLRRWDEAIADYTRALALSDKSSGTWRLRGVARAELGQWEEAVADMAEAAERAPTSVRVLTDLAIAHLGRGDLPAYRRACLRVYERLGHSNTTDYWNSLSWVCCLAANDVEPARLAKLMDGAVAVEPKNYARLNTRGAVLYRAGRFEDAVKQLSDAVDVHGAGGSFEDWVFLAMAHFRLDHADKARTDLKRAFELFDERFKASSKDPPPDWSLRVEWRTLRKEAEQLIK